MWQNDLAPPCARSERSPPVSRRLPMKSALLVAFAIAAAAPASATDVNIVGLYPGKAVVVINRGMPRTIAVGERTPEGVVLISSDSRVAVVEVDGKRERLEMGQHFETAAQTGARTTVTLSA